MFDFSFSEIALIGAVALVVIGPERLPRVARTAGVVVGRLQRYAATVRADISREVELSELKRVQGEITDAARSFETTVRESLTAAENELEASRQAVMSGPQPSGAPGLLPAGQASAQPDLGSAGHAGVHAAAPVGPDATGPGVQPLQTSLFSPAETPPGESAERVSTHAPAQSDRS